MRNEIDFNNQKVQDAIFTIMGIIGPDRPVAIVGPDRNKIARQNRIIIIGPNNPPIPDPPPAAIMKGLVKALAEALKLRERKIALVRAKALIAYASEIEKIISRGG